MRAISTASVQGATVTGTTDATGKLLYSLKIKPSDPLGTWQVQATATKNGITGSTATSFTVQSGPRKT